ncbi:MAG: FHA domain-containing protein [Zetaproteobacteria bacterium]|nr:MAG: FHA domain-containing protein [Zetaproteobacteria bacterium]
MPKLIVTAPDGVAREHPFSSDITIGRHPMMDVVVLDPLVSKRHAKIEMVPGHGWRYRDLGSKNGSFFGGVRIQERLLQDGDEIRIGRSRLRFVARTEDEALISSISFVREAPAPIAAQANVEAAAHLAPGVEIADLGELRREYEKMRLGFELLQRLGALAQPKQVFQEAARALLDIFSADHCAILLFADGRFRPAAFAAREASEDNIVVSESVLDEVRRTRQAVLLADTGKNARFREARSIVMTGMRSVMCTPILAVNQDLVGAVFLDSTRGAVAFSPQDLELLAGLAGHLALAVENAKLFERVRHEAAARAQLARLLSPELADRIIAGEIKLDRHSHAREATIMFADIRGFTQLVKRYPPEKLVQTLNAFFDLAAKTIFRFGGMVDKYIGDEVMAVFGAPIAVDAPADRAVAAAVRILELLREFNEKQAAAGEPRLGVGIGISAGEVVFGAVGSEETLQYTCIGLPVNVAARLTELARSGEILISEEACQRMKVQPDLEEITAQTVRGLDAPVRTFRIRHAGSTLR